MRFSDLPPRQQIFLIAAGLGFLFFMIVGFAHIPISPSIFILTLIVYFGFAYLIGLARPGGILALIGTVCILAAAHLALPPYIVNTSGSSTASGLAQASIDSALYNFYIGMNVQPGLMWWAVYPISFAILMFVGINLATRHEAWRKE